MTTANPTLTETRFVDARERAPSVALERLKSLLGETLDVLHGAVLPVSTGDDGLDAHTRRDLGLR